METLFHEYACTLCDKILKKPISIHECTCDRQLNVCKEHVFTENSNKKRKSSLECPKCHCAIETSKILENELLTKQIENYEYLSHDEKQLKLNLDKIFEKLKDVTRELKVKIDEFSLVQADHFESMRREIDIRRESLIQEIFLNEDQSNKRLDALQCQSSEMIERVKTFEREFRANFSTNLKPNLVAFDLDQELERISEFFRCRPKFESKAFASQCRAHFLNYDQTLKELLKRSENFKLYEYDLRRNRVELSTNDLNHIGNLVLTRDFFTNATNEEILNIAVNSFECGELEQVKNRMRILNLNTNSLLKSIIIDELIECTLFDDSTKCVSFGTDLIRVWDLTRANQTCVKTYRHEHVKCVRVLTRDRLASGSENGSIKIWNLMSLNQSKCMQNLKGHTQRILGLEQILPDDENLLLSVSWDGSIRVWCCNRRKCKRIIRGSEFKFIKSTQNYGLFACLSSSPFTDKQIEIWNYRTGECVTKLKGHRASITQLEYYSSKNQLISCSCDKTVRIWDMTRFVCVRVIQTLLDSIQLNTNNELSVKLLGFEDKYIYMYDINNTCECLKKFQLDKICNQVQVCSNSSKFLEIC
jgi:hypothetical protein